MLTGVLSFTAAKPAMIRKAVEARVDPVLFGWSYDYVGDLAETAALIWPAHPGANREPELDEVVDALRVAARGEVPGLLEGWLDALDGDGRWGLAQGHDRRLAGRGCRRGWRNRPWPTSAMSP